MDDVTVYFQYDTARFSLNYPYALINMTVVNLKKLFKYMLTGNQDANKKAVYTTYTTEEALECIVTLTNAARHVASGYKAVKTADSQYVRAVRLRTYFKETKAKYFD
ncbi:MAG: hypothetical protein IJS45_11500 [Clostridia bacterium]|nr:hypothetical protein [Clostridia bacterium]